MQIASIAKSSFSRNSPWSLRDIYKSCITGRDLYEFLDQASLLFFMTMKCIPVPKTHFGLPCACDKWMERNLERLSYPCNPKSSSSPVGAFNKVLHVNGRDHVVHKSKHGDELDIKWYWTGVGRIKKLTTLRQLVKTTEPLSLCLWQ